MVVYEITNTVNGKRYIGITGQTPPEKRWRAHINDANSGIDRAICRAIRKYGSDNFVFKVIEVVSDQALLIERESYWIKHLNTSDPRNGYNMNEGGFGCITHTVDAKQKIAAANRISMKGNQNRLGAVLSDQTKKKISEARIGQTSPRKGVVLTDATKQKISQAKIGTISKARKSYIIQLPDGTEQTITGLSLFCKKHGISAGNLLVHGKTKGFTLLQRL